MSDARIRLLALRGVLYGLVVTWLWKWDFFVQACIVYRYRPLQVAFFPQLLQSFGLMACALVAPLLLAFYALLRGQLRATAASFSGFALASALLLLHLGTYNDATFVTSLWVSLVGLWLHKATATLDEGLPVRVATMTQLLIGLLFFGGVVGKLTPGYFDGSVLYDLYFLDRDYWPYTWARSWLAPEQLRQAAVGYSWFVLTVEAALASLPIWPPKPALQFAVVSLIGLVVFNNPQLGSVVSSLMSLVLVSLWLLRQPVVRSDRSS